MKSIITVITFIATFMCFVCVIDPAIVECILDIAQPPNEWFGVVKIAVWAIVWFSTTGIAILISFLASVIAAVFIK